MFRSAFSLVLVFVIFLGLITAQFAQADEDQLFLDLLQQIDSDGQDDPDPLEDLQPNAAYSSIARCLTDNIASITNWSCKWCKQEAIQHGVSHLVSVKAGLTSPSKLGWYVGYSASSQAIYVVFKSSGGIENWLLNLDYAPVDYSLPGCSGCKVHKGFYHAYKDELKPAILDAIQKVREENKCDENVPIVVTGHSLGAAMTTFAALELFGHFSRINIAGIEYWHNHSSPMFNDLSDAEYLNLHNTALSLQQSDNLKIAKFNSLNEIPTNSFTPKLPIYNYGSPRVGNQQFSDFFQKTIGKNKFFRVTHRADPVPHVPTLTMGAIHVGREIWFPNKDIDPFYKECKDDITEDPACSNSQIAIAFMDHKWYGGWSMLQDAKDSC